MKHVKIEGIIEKRLERINAAFDNVQLHFNEDDIRVFRVKVKKLAAFLHLVDQAKNLPHPIKVPQKIAKIYQISGAIRTLQMQQDLVLKTLKGNEIAYPDGYLQLISEKILSHIALFDKHIKGLKPFKKEEEKLVKLLPGNISQKVIDEFILAEAHRLEQLLSPVFPNDRSFHKANILLKDLLYISPYIDVEIGELCPYSLLSTFEDIDSFTVLLGGFQDLTTAIDSLHIDCAKIEIDEQEKIALQNIGLAWVKKRETTRAEIINQIQKITSSKHKSEPLAISPVM